MHYEPKVSVIIPTFNRADYVTKAVESVLRQSMQDFEIILVDDGSTDDTAKRLRKYGSKISYVRTRNQGFALARNTGLQAARGEYIAYLDSDDEYLEHKLEIQAGLLDEYPEVGIVYTEFSAFDDAGYYDESHLKEYHSSAYKRGVSYDDVFFHKVPLSQMSFAVRALKGANPEWLNRFAYFGRIFDTYLLKTIVFTNSIMFRRSMLSVIGLQNPRFGLFTDLEFVLRMCKDCAVAFIDVPTYRLRYHPDQISASNGETGARITIKKQMDLLRVLKAHGFADREYYNLHRTAIDRQLAGLHRAVAVPLLSYCDGNSHRNKYYPNRARKYLHKCAALGRPEYFLWILSYLPHFWRRLGFKFISVRQQATEALRQRFS